MSKHTSNLTSDVKGPFTSLIYTRPYLFALLLMLITSYCQARPGTVFSQPKRSHAVATIVVGIISYARWPSEPNPIQLCVTAPTHYAVGLFNPLLLSASRPIKTLNLPFNSPELGRRCDVIYLGNVSQAQKRSFIRRIAGQSILSISENDAECSTGSAFCLQSNSDQVSFKVNLDALARSGVRVHPNALQLAREQVQPR